MTSNDWWQSFIDLNLPKKIQNTFFAASGDNPKMEKILSDHPHSSNLKNIKPFKANPKSGFSFITIHESKKVEGERHFFNFSLRKEKDISNFSLPLPPTTQTLRH